MELWPKHICDAHLHYGRPDTLKELADTSPLRERFACCRSVQFDKMDNYAARLAEHRVEKTVLIPFVFREVDIEAENRLVIEASRSKPGAYFPYALLDEGDPFFAERHYSEIVGLKQHIVLHKTELTAERKEILDCLQQHELILLLHTHAANRIAYVSEIVRNFPHLKIQIAHMGRAEPGNEAFMLAVLTAMRGYDTVFFDTSTVRQPQIVKKAVNLVGADRILYGSDFPFFMDQTGAEDIMEQQIRHILRAGLTQAEQEKIFAANFEHFVTFGKQR